MKHWTSMTIEEMVEEFRNLFSAAELREELAENEKALADRERRKAAIEMLLKEGEDDASAE